MLLGPIMNQGIYLDADCLSLIGYTYFRKMRPAVTVCSLGFRLLWSFIIFAAPGLRCEQFAFFLFWCVSGFSARFSLKVKCRSCSLFTAPSALHEVCLWSVGFFSLVFLFHLQPEPPLTNYSCGVTSRSCCSICLRGQPQCVCVCARVYHVYYASWGIVWDCVLCQHVCVCVVIPTPNQSPWQLP